MINPDAWARTAIRHAPCEADSMGLSYSDASRRAVAICAEGARTGQTRNAMLHLRRLCAFMDVARCLAA